MAITTKTIERWAINAEAMFRSIMPEIGIPYPQPVITNERNHYTIRRELIDRLDCDAFGAPKNIPMEYLNGTNGKAFVLRKKLVSDCEYENFLNMYWHELGYFYAISTQTENLNHYSDQHLIFDFLMSDTSENAVESEIPQEHFRQEGYWFWIEFIAEAISKYVSFMYRSCHRPFQL